MENKLFYCKSESFKDSKIEVQSKKYNKIFNFQSKSIKELKNEIQGKLYSTQLDKNSNPKYNIQEGTFSFDLEQKLIKLIKKDKEYLGKSNILLHENTQKPQDETNKTKHQELRSQSLPSRKKIIIKEDGIIVNNRQIGEHRRQFQKLKIWCKYNQSLNERDEQILKNKQWLTSSIIDSFVFHLNLEGEKEYIKQKENNDTKQINRILFLPTSLTTNFGIQYDIQKAQQLFQQELLEYQEMDFQLNLIYDKIGIPINKNNIHWQFLLFDYKKNCVELFDSLSQSFKFDQNLIETLAQLLQLQNYKQKRLYYYIQQQNGYACGYYVCSFMYYQYRLQFDKNLEKYSYIEEQITKLLLDVIKDQENQ
ncbi:unnamed protein product [Paramecium primaurelia]|uniref:Ubiquitin-like protease family profile domain-containing protein n=1 Tax=Paramecium primaurelia TaxID=5886 RepID=A0A8S1PJU9_PARPR|nr:unnamed protein product [Paramecium primaurelia]